MANFFLTGQTQGPTSNPCFISFSGRELWSDSIPKVAPSEDELHRERDSSSHLKWWQFPNDDQAPGRRQGSLEAPSAWRASQMTLSRVRLASLCSSRATMNSSERRLWTTCFQVSTGTCEIPKYRQASLSANEASSVIHSFFLVSFLFLGHLGHLRYNICDISSEFDTEIY